MMQLTAAGISAGYSEIDVLHAVDVHVSSGEFVGLIGPNGCGKSTLLRALTRTLPCSAGSVTLDSVPIAQLSAIEIARRVAFVPQQEPADFDFTVRDVVLMGRYPHRSPQKGDSEQDYALVKQALAEADITSLEMRPITQLSGGEHRRVLLARALAQDTPLLLLDEPTAHLDVTHQAELLALIQRLVRTRSVGALAALHELNLASEYCDRLVLMRDGVVVDMGAPETVVTPENLRTAYGARARVGRNPVTGRPIVLSVASLRSETNFTPTQSIHLICGGGSGIHILHALLRHGYSVTAGVLNENDSDWETAQALGVEVAAEAPFSAISRSSREAARSMMAHATVVIISDVPFGAGNVENLNLAVEAQKAGKQVVLLGCDDTSRRDYTEGQATALIEEMLGAGAARFSDIEDWIAIA